MELTFEQLPKAVATIMESLERIEKLLQQKNEVAIESEKFLTVNETAEFLNLAVPTIYGLIHARQIPFNKRTKRIYFLKSDLVEWVKAGRRKTLVEIEMEASNYLLKPRGQKRKY